MRHTSPLKRKLWLIALVAGGIMAAVAVLLKVGFIVGAVHPDQLQPPKNLTTIIPASTTHTLVRASKLYDKWSPEKTTAIDWTSCSLELKDSDEQMRWVVEHREFINDMMQLASAGGIPGISYEQAAALSRIKGYQFPPNEYIYRKRIVVALIAESHRRRNAGDESGAADALIAAYRISKSLSRPFFSNFLMGQYTQTRANEELKRWICADTMTSATAHRMRKELAVNAITLNDYRRMNEIDYLFGRAKLVQALDGRFSELMKYQGLNMILEAWKEDENFRKEIKIYVEVPRVVLHSAYMKLTASKCVEKFDTDFRQTQSDIEMNLPALKQNPDLSSRFQPFKLHVAQARINLLALDLISGTTASLQIDPFSNKPLGRIEETSDTLIYSIGPDYKDQHGTVTYDPDNENGGDVTMKVPWRK